MKSRSGERVLLKVFIGVVSVTEVTEEMVLSQVAKQLIIVHVALITKAAQRMATVRPVICITNTTMCCKVLPIVKFALKREYLHT